MLRKGYQLLSMAKCLPKGLLLFGRRREQIQHHPQNCYLKPEVAAEWLLLGNSFQAGKDKS